ncbi:MAG TPA: twin-arginine translocase TatA/TatE family subunit [Bacteroidales bacterium]
MESGILLFALGTPEVIGIVVIVLILFGGKKIPELMNGIGKGVRSFKDGVKDVEKEIHDATKEIDETKK